ncbi:hypothetical protein JCM17846_17450 [Iodidimonas nitroreducens]|uniref:DUF2794 domain-containing protein n=1 Tax=Iodidimonas nitroreducens TaxID=1236968 RepID=A0A5A7N6V4_9PROT|nr:hypothetical protein AQ1_02354 [alpha proteobacterium Q-1]GER04063.1 hypothetical protein JCM17846_17450 [Iodidimonas nitroreducens]
MNFHVTQNSDGVAIMGHQPAVMFARPELMRILDLYGRFVAAGLWRDYGLHAGRDQAEFAIFRRTSERPAYRIIKIPARANRQGAWLVLGMEGQVLRRGHHLDQVLRLFDRHLLKLID